MSDQFNLNDEVLKEKIKTLFDEDLEIRKWNDGLLIKSLILFPIIVFLVGLFVINRPPNFSGILFIFLYPLILTSIGLIILFFMKNNIK